jgi:hypothetical protein
MCGEAVDPAINSISIRNDEPVASTVRRVPFGGNVKTQFMSRLLILGLLIAAGDICAKAQALAEGSIKADVPFAFIVGKKMFPAGKYTLKLADDTNPGVLEIRNDNRRGTILFGAETAQAKENPRQTELVFDKIGDQYFLSEIWASDTNVGYRLLKTNAETSLEGGDIKTEHRSIPATVHGIRKTSK